MNAEYDVAIVGYGPVGATLAALLGRAGLSVAVVEAQREIYDKPRAISIDHEALRIFQWCGIGDELPALLGVHPGTHYHGVDGQLIRKFDPAPPPFRLGWPPNVTFVQPELESVLRAAVEKTGRVRLFVPYDAIGIEAGEQGVALSIRERPAGRSQILTARYVVGCDGGNSFVRKQLDLPLEDLAYDEYWLVVDALLKREASLPDRCIQYCQPARPATFILGPRNLRRWEIKLLPDERPEDFAAEANILQQLSRFVDRDALSIWRTAVYRFHALVAQRWRAGRCFIAGDAAHQMPPFLGQGLCSGLRDAGNLAWKLHLVERGGASPDLLDSYEAERKPHIRELVEVTKAFGRVISELDVAAARRRDAELEALLASGKAVTVRQRFIPGLVAGIVETGADGQPRKAAGTLFVQSRIRTEHSEARLDDVLGRGFLIASRSGVAQQWLTAESLAAWARIGGERVVIHGNVSSDDAAGARRLVETDGIFDLWTREQDCEAAVVRPDRYVYGVASDGTSLNRLVASVHEQVFG